MTRFVLWMIGGLLVIAAAVGIVGIVMGGTCGCADPNSVCAASVCPSSDVLWFICAFVGVAGATIAFIGAGVLQRNARLKRYQRARAPVSAEVAPDVSASQASGFVTNQRAWSTPSITTAQAPVLGEPVGGSPGAVSPNDDAEQPTGEAQRLRQLTQLDDLRKTGAITQAEFEQEKQRILAENPLG